MLFNSYSFFVFLAIVVVVSRMIPSWRFRKLFLLLGSYLFYAAWNPPFVSLLWISTVVDWYATKAIARATRPERKRLYLGLSLLTNLGMLGYFKYADFLLFNSQVFLSGLAHDRGGKDRIVTMGNGVEMKHRIVVAQ